MLFTQRKIPYLQATGIWRGSFSAITMAKKIKKGMKSRIQGSQLLFFSQNGLTFDDCTKEKEFVRIWRFNFTTEDTI